MKIADNIKPAYWTLRSTYRLLTNRIRLLPDYIIIGTQRGGTTSLYFYLTELSGIAEAQNKEVHFFDDYYREGLRWYRSQFPTYFQKYYFERIRKQRFITGESSPYYLYHPVVPKRLAAIRPNARLIVLLRNPVDRSYSHHWLAPQQATEPFPFEKAIKFQAERLQRETRQTPPNTNPYIPTHPTL